MFLLIWFFIVALLCPSAFAHDWYPPDCCSGHDCRPIDESEVRELSWSEVVDLVTGQHLTGTQIRQSQDGQWHMCNQGGTRQGKPLCVFRPQPSY